MHFQSIFRAMYTILLSLVHFYVVHSLEISEALDEIPGLRYMGTKTPYIFSNSAKKLRRTKGLENESSDVINFFKNEDWKHTCKPVHVSFTGRHGNRLPSLNNMKYIEKFVAAIQDEFEVHSVRPEIDNINGKVYQMIRDWKLPYKYSEEKTLNDWGYNEIYEISERFARNFRDLFSLDDFHYEDEAGTVPHSKSEILEDISVITSEKSRAFNSAKEFLRGLRDVIRNPFLTDAELEYNNHLTRFHSYCTKFKKIWATGALGKEVTKYMRSSDILNIADKVSKKLGLGEHITCAGKILGKDNAGKMVWTILNACYGETAYHGQISAWCLLLDEEDFKKLAFSNDLKHYYKNTGYVETTGGSQSCELMQNIFQHIDKTIVGRRLHKPYKKMVLRFGHAETLIPLYSLLGMFKEPENLTADYLKHENRVFDLSRIAPHSANLQVVLYECSEHEESTPVKLDQYMVQVLVNEMEEILPMCKYSLCSYKEVRDYYRQHIEFCDIAKICDKEPGADEFVKDEL